MTNTATHAACPEHTQGVLFVNASTQHVHCTIGGTDCASWSDLTAEPGTRIVTGERGYLFVETTDECGGGAR